MKLMIGEGVLDTSEVLDKLLGFNEEWPSQCTLIGQYVGSRIRDKNYQWLGSSVGDKKCQWLGSRGRMLSNIVHEIVSSALPSTMISYQKISSNR